MAFSMHCKRCGCYEASHSDPDFEGIACEEYVSPDPELEETIKDGAPQHKWPNVEISPRAALQTEDNETGRTLETDPIDDLIASLPDDDILAKVTDTVEPTENADEAFEDWFLGESESLQNLSAREIFIAGYCFAMKAAASPVVEGEELKVLRARLEAAHEAIRGFNRRNPSSKRLMVVRPEAKGEIDAALQGTDND